MSAIIAILNTHSPASGANIAQIVVRSDGSVTLHGDEAMARFAVGKLVNSPLPAETAPRPRQDVPVPLRRGPGRPRKHPLPAASADASE